MSDIICVTNRKLCAGDFAGRIRMIAREKPAGIILREKDLAEDEYRRLAETVLAVCRKYGTLCILHQFVQTALSLEVSAIHLPLPLLRSIPAAQKERFSILGASCHSAEDAREAQKLGCTYITAGHIFDTDCKKGTPGRGTAFLQEICRSVSIPVYAIGGIRPENIGAVRTAGAKGACVMSALMTCGHPSDYLNAFKE